MGGAVFLVPGPPGGSGILVVGIVLLSACRDRGAIRVASGAKFGAQFILSERPGGSAPLDGLGLL